MKSNKKIKQDKAPSVPLNDGINTPVPNKDPITKEGISPGEAALFKQAENPLGDPHKT